MKNLLLLIIFGLLCYYAYNQYFASSVDNFKQQYQQVHSRAHGTTSDAEEYHKIMGN